MDTEVSNGTGVATDPLADIIEQLEAQKAPLAARRAQLEAEVAELLKQEQRISAGIAALRPAPRMGRPPKPKPDARSKHDWQPSQKVVDDVYAAFVGSEEPLSMSAAADLVHNSRGTVAKAIELLRSQERLRLVGRGSGHGRPKLYAVMP